MEANIPETMKAIRLREPRGTLNTEIIPVPEPGPGEVLVRMHSSPVNPSDLAMIREGYLERDYPFTPGLEGSGTVVACGGGWLARLRLGKRVACSPKEKGDGSWAEYMVTSVFKTAPLPDSITMEQGSMMLVNPMTAMAFIQMAREEGHSALINTAAASSLGKMMVRLCQQYGLPLINIVRRDQQVKELREMGATYVFQSEAASFQKDLTGTAADLNATLILDAVAGEQSAILLSSAPPGSVLVNYARLSGKPVMADPPDLMMKKKQVKGFQLGVWLSEKPLLFKLRFIASVKRNMVSALRSDIRQVFPMERVEEMIDLYSSRMSGGKVILRLTSPPHPSQEQTDG